MEELLKKLSQGDQKTLEKVYDIHRKPFLDFMGKMCPDKALLEDIYQDAVIALYENAVKGKLKELNSSLKTYLFAIGKYMVYKRLNKKKGSLTIISDLPEELEWEEWDEEPLNSRITLLRSYLDELGDKCKQILKMSYFEERSTEEMVSLLGYPNKETLKSQKSRCMQHLKKKFQVKEK